MTVDFFPPMVDDPRLFGQVAAANSLSDVYAMGGRPLVALNLVGFPSKKLSLEILAEILNGGAEKVHEAGAVIGGGHSVEDQEIKYGMSVTGEVHPDRVWKNGQVRRGDLLILTKPIGSGLICSGVKNQAACGAVVDEAIRWMTTLNGTGIEHLHAARVSAATDITGFGLVGHARELACGSGTTLVIRSADVPRIAGVEQFFDAALRTGGGRQTKEFVKPVVALPAALDEWSHELLHDPQTSGGLLVAIHPDDADRAVARLQESGLVYARVIGEAVAQEGDICVRVV
jgi:selenide, water dikinase